MKSILFVVIIFFLLAIAVAVGSQNEAYVAVNYLIAKADIRIATLIAICISIGILIGILIMLTSWLNLRVKLILARTKLNKLTKAQQ